MFVWLLGCFVVVVVVVVVVAVVDFCRTFVVVVADVVVVFFLSFFLSFLSFFLFFLSFFFFSFFLCKSQRGIRPIPLLILLKEVFPPINVETKTLPLYNRLNSDRLLNEIWQLFCRVVWQKVVVISLNRLVGLVVNASASRAEDPGFESRLRREFFGSSHTSYFKIGTPVPTLLTVWRYRVSAGTGWTGVSILWLGEVEITIIIIIAFKGAIRDFLQSPHSAENCLQHVRSSGPGAIVCKSRATHRALITCKCHVKRHLVRRDSSAIKFDRVEIAFIWAYFVGWTIKPMKEGRKPECPEKTPGDELQKMPEDSSPKRDSNPRSSIGGRLGKQTC